MEDLGSLDSGFSKKINGEATLDQLAERIRAALHASHQDRCNALHHHLDAGDALIAAQRQVVAAGWGWKRWLKENCSLSVRTAMLYMQLARHREQIEAEIDRVADLSLRAAVRLISKPANKPKRPDPHNAADAEVTKWLAAMRLNKFLRLMPNDWRPQLARRIAGLNAKDGESNVTLKLVNRAAEPPEKGHTYTEITRQIKLHDELAIIKNTSLDSPTELDALIELKQLDKSCAAGLVSRAANGEAVSAAAEIDNRKFKPQPDAAELEKIFTQHSHAFLRAWTRATPATRRQWLKNMERDVDLLESRGAA